MYEHISKPYRKPPPLLSSVWPGLSPCRKLEGQQWWSMKFHILTANSLGEKNWSKCLDGRFCELSCFFTSTGTKSHQSVQSHISQCYGYDSRKSHQGRKVPSLNRNPNGTAVSFLGAYFPMGTTSRYDFLLCRNRGALIYPFVMVHVKCCKKLTKKTHPFRSNHQFQPPKHHASLCQIAISQITQEYNVEHFFLQKELSSSFI